MNNEKNAIDWQSKYFQGHVTLHEALLQYMFEGRVIPHQLTEAFHKAINDYQYGLSERLNIGLDERYPISQTKRFKFSQNLSLRSEIKREVEAFHELGLAKVKTNDAKPIDRKTQNRVYEYLKNNTYMRNKTFISKDDFINRNTTFTAFQGASELFCISESTIRRYHK